MSDPSVRPGAEAFRFDGGPDGVLLIHGFTGSPASLRPLGEWLASRGIEALGVRLPGHGTRVEDLRRTTWADWAAEAHRGLDLLLASCERVTVVAQSMGGALALHLAANRPVDVAGLALLNPYVRDPRLAIAPVARLFLRNVKGVGNDIRKPGQDEVAYDRMPVPAVAGMRRLLATTRRELPRVAAPLLVFRSAQDHAIPRGNPEFVMMHAGSPEKELIECPNSFHVISLDLDAEMVRERILAFIRGTAATAPPA